MESTVSATPRLGLGTPQGNPTVEPEMRLLIPDHINYYTLRLDSNSTDSAQRIKEYLLHLPEMVKRYAGLRLDAFMFACTASTYLLDPQTLAKSKKLTESALGAPVITAADAIIAWLRQREYQRISLVSPYPQWLNDIALEYWRSQEFQIAEVVRIDTKSQDTYSIYGLDESTPRKAMTEVKDDTDAIVVAGTGMPSLASIRELRSAGRAIVSSNMALAEVTLNGLAV